MQGRVAGRSTIAAPYFGAPSRCTVEKTPLRSTQARAQLSRARNRSVGHWLRRIDQIVLPTNPGQQEARQKSKVASRASLRATRVGAGEQAARRGLPLDDDCRGGTGAARQLLAHGIWQAEPLYLSLELTASGQRPHLRFLTNSAGEEPHMHSTGGERMPPVFACLRLDAVVGGSGR